MFNLLISTVGGAQYNRLKWVRKGEGACMGRTVYMLKKSMGSTSAEAGQGFASCPSPLCLYGPHVVWSPDVILVLSSRPALQMPLISELQPPLPSGSVHPCPFFCPSSTPRASAELTLPGTLCVRGRGLFCDMWGQVSGGDDY